MKFFRNNVFGYEDHLWKISLQTDITRNVIALSFTYVNPHPVYSIDWLIYASFRTLCIWTYNAYMRQLLPKVINTCLAAW